MNHFKRRKSSQAKYHKTGWNLFGNPRISHTAEAMLVRGKYGISLINFIGFLAVYILIYSIVPVEGLLPLPPITLVPPSAVEPNPTRPPHGRSKFIKSLVSVKIVPIRVQLGTRETTRHET